MIRNKRLWCRISNTDYGYYLHTNKITTPSICVRTGGETLYCPLTTGSSKLHVRYNNTNYGVQSYIPVLNFQIYFSASTGAYGYNTSMQVRNISMSNSVSISKQIQIRAKTTGNSSTYTLSTMNAGATSASAGSASSFSPGSSTPGATFYVYIGGSLATSYSISTYGASGWQSKSYSIPTSYW